MKSLVVDPTDLITASPDAVMAHGSCHKGAGGQQETKEPPQGRQAMTLLAICAP